VVDIAGSLVAMNERVITAVVHNQMAQIRAVESEFPVPIGFDEADTWEQLENYLDDLRFQEPVWEALIMHWAQGVSPEEPGRGLVWAVHEAVREENRLERLLMRAGDWDGTEDDTQRALAAGAHNVRMRQYQKRLKVAEKAVEAAHKIEASPKFWVTGPVPDIDPLMVAAGVS
jgi:hypothetical protein